MPGPGRAISDTCNGEKEKCKAGWGYHAKNFRSEVAHCYECCLVTI